MRHNKLKKINKKSKHRELMFNNMIYSIIKYRKISTSIYKYRILKKIFDKKIKKIKKDKKFFFEFINNIKLNNKIIIYFLNKIKKKNSGFLKVNKVRDRKGDFTKIIYLEL
ncbi:L17 family ribosomal protein [Candidatus Vidania fulgoroideorum]